MFQKHWGVFFRLLVQHPIIWIYFDTNLVVLNLKKYMTLNGDVLSRNCTFFALFWSTLQLALREWQVQTRWLDGPGLGSGSFYKSSFFSGCLVHPARSCKKMPTKNTIFFFYSLEGHTHTCRYMFFVDFPAVHLFPHPPFQLWVAPLVAGEKTGGCRGEGSLTCLACSCIVRVGTTRMDGRMGLVSRFKVL